MNVQIIIALVIALGGFGSAWKVQDWRYGAKEAERAEQELANQQRAAAAAIRQSEAVIQAQSAATIRVAALRRDADGERSALIGLSHATDAAMRAAAVTHEACVERAATLGELFNTSAKEYTSMAEKAGNHASDVQTLTDAWPKSAK